MAIDYEALGQGMAAAVPFNAHLGLEHVSIGPGEAVIRLPDDERLRNHVGSYTKLAKGPIEAAAKLDDHEALLAALDAEGRVSFPIEVELTDSDGNTVATATVRWHVRRNA